MECNPITACTEAQKVSTHVCMIILWSVYSRLSMRLTKTRVQVHVYFI